MRNQLFDITIRSNSSLSLAEQVYSILSHEIHSGRWHVGDRLPSIIELAKQAGLSAFPIQQAFERLRLDGYIRNRGRAGTFLIATHPGGQEDMGTIGVVVVKPDTHHSPEFRAAQTGERLSTILDTATRRKFTIEVRHLAASDDWSEIDTIGRYFRKEVKGVISLHDFPHPIAYNLSPKKMPFVRWGAFNHTSLPVVSSNSTMGNYNLTRLLLRKGHRNIILMQNPERGTTERSLPLEGYQSAMREAGFTPNMEAAEASLELIDRNIKILERFLERYADATAIVLPWMDLTDDLVTTLYSMGRRIPEDVSLVGRGYTFKRPDGTIVPVTRLHPNYDRSSNECFNILIEQMRTRRCAVSHILLLPDILKGESVAPLRPSEAQYAMSSSPTRKTSVE